MSIGVIGVDVAIREVGVQPDGQLEIPDETEVGWYGLGSAPGAPGTTVFAAHVNWHRRPGPFLRLRELQPGADVIVTLADGTSRAYSVTERAQYPKGSLPSERVWSRSGVETLVLITCGGDFDSTQRRFHDNVVVYAVPVATDVAAPSARPRADRREVDHLMSERIDARRRLALVTGATGYVGGRLVPELLRAGWTVRALARTPKRLRDAPWAGDVEVAVADVDRCRQPAHGAGGRRRRVLPGALHRRRRRFEDTDRRAATTFADRAEAAGVAASSTSAA